MGLKVVEIEDAGSCWNKASDCEPIFILRAQDKLAPEIIRAWAVEAHLNGCGEAKVNEAFRIASEMEAWPTRKYPD